MGYKLDWTDEEILQYALGKLDVSEYEIDGMKYFLKMIRLQNKNMKTICKIINMDNLSEKEHKEYQERIIQIIREKRIIVVHFLSNRILGYGQKKFSKF